MKREFQVGDFVAAYGVTWDAGWSKRITGELIEKNPNGTFTMKISFTLPDKKMHETTIVDPKQCRRIRKKEKRKARTISVYVDYDGITRLDYSIKWRQEEYGKYFKFLEVLPEESNG